jgi:hypothetical protein
LQRTDAIKTPKEEEKKPLTKSKKNTDRFWMGVPLFGLEEIWIGPNSAGFIFNLFIIVSVLNSVILRAIDAENYRYHFKHF